MPPKAEDIRELPTLCVGQCCSLKIEDDSERVWLCRVYGGVSIERYDSVDGKWKVTEGGCSPNGRFDTSDVAVDDLARWHRDR